jgi:hypothetical protein
VPKDFLQFLVCKNRFLGESWARSVRLSLILKVRKILILRIEEVEGE